MRKLLTVIVASGAMIAVMPATALAKRGHRHHARAHHGRVHHKRFGTDPAPVAAAPTPVLNTAPPSGATIMSFTNGVLTINTVNPAGTVAGLVTVDTRIECISPASSTGTMEPTGEDQGHDHGGFGDNGGGNGFGPGQGGDDQGQGDDNQGDDDQSEMQGCDMSALTPNASIQFADLAVAADGVATWDKVVVIMPTTPTTTAPPTVADTDGDGF